MSIYGIEEDGVACGEKRTPRVVIAGALPPPLGGVTVLLDELVRTVQVTGDLDITVVRIPVRVRGALARLTAFVSFAARLHRAARRADIVTLHLPTLQLWTLGLAGVLVSKAARRTVLVRKFGGSDVERLHEPARYLTKWVIRHADLFCAESKGQVDWAREIGCQGAVWFSNHRMMPAAIRPFISGERRDRFVFVSHVKRTKGVELILDALRLLKGHISVDFYGPLIEPDLESKITNTPGAKFLGMLPPEEVVPTIAQYRALLLPTFHDGEGYPGVILEAYAAGVPVVVSRWRFLPEIVSEDSGIIIDPHDSAQLADALATLRKDELLLEHLAAGVRARRAEFSTARWSLVFVELCRRLIVAE